MAKRQGSARQDRSASAGRLITGKASVVRIVERDGRIVVEKRNAARRKGYARREFRTVNEIHELLTRHGYSDAAYRALSATATTITTSYVPGPTLEEALQRGPWTPALVRKMRRLGEVFALVQQAYRKAGAQQAVESREPWDLGLTRRIFASGLRNFIVTRTAIVPIDLGTKEEYEHPLVQVARFLVYLRIACLRPWRRPPERYIRRIEDAFLKGYAGDAERVWFALGPYMSREYQRLVGRALRGTWGVRGAAFLMLAFRECRRVSARRRMSARRIMTRFASIIRNRLRWSFYKADINAPQLANDIDVVCEEPLGVVTKVLRACAQEGNAFRLDGLVFHLHAECATHTRLFFRWDLGPFILATRVRTREGWYRPCYPAWLFVRTVFLVKKPRKWLRKQFKRFFVPACA